MRKLHAVYKICAIGFLGFILAASMPQGAHADATSSAIADLNSQIQDKNSQIDQLNTEIKQYQAQVDATGKQADTLQNALDTLTASGKQLQSEYDLTNTNIDKAELNLEQLGLEVKTQEQQIEQSNAAIAETIRTMDQADSNSMIEVLLTQPDLTSMWNDMAALNSLDDELAGHISDLKKSQVDLQNKEQETVTQKTQLASYQSTLEDKQKLIEQNKQTKADLLDQTKDQEDTYKQILAEKEAQEAQFQQELSDLESKLQFTLNPNTIPPAGTPVLHWPLSSVRITQYFGNTEFAKTAAYNGQGHNGIDIAASIGTPVMAALDGTVIAVNSTQVGSMCQYGKWVLIQHPDGLTTLYAHLSLVKATKGEQVTTGQIIGYSGDTGYVTGPHLHLSVYVSAAVKFEEYKCASGPTVPVPISAFSGYLNPMDYLPPVP